MDITLTPQREYKDRLFKAIFGRDTEESKRWRLDLYNALNNTNYTDPNALELNTIENVIYITIQNPSSTRTVAEPMNGQLMLKTSI